MIGAPRMAFGAARTDSERLESAVAANRYIDS